MASSTTQVANLALGKIGQARIESLSDSNEPARWANEFFGQARDYVTEAGLWRHAKRTQTLESATNDRANDYTYAYTRPSDCLRFFLILPQFGAFDQRYLIRFESEAGIIYCDEPTARGVYVRQITDVTKWAPSFTDAVAWYLAHLIVSPLRLENGLIATTLQGYKNAIAHAGAMGAVEQLIIRSADEEMSEWHRGR